MRRLTNIAPTLALLGLACGQPPASRTTAAAPPAGSMFETGDPRVGAFVSSPRTFRTNTFWVEGPRGIVLIDTGFLPADGVAALELAERATGKRVELAVVLHPNPDKFNGTAALQARGVRVVTSSEVLSHIPHVHEIRHRAFASRYPGEYPDEAAAPESFGDATTTLEVAGVTLTLHVLERGCSDAHVVVEWEGNLFVGDLVANRNHSWMELGYLDEWVARIDELAALSPRYVHPGRGPSGGPELLSAERDYLEEARELVTTSAPEDRTVDHLRAEIEARHPGYGFAVFLNIGLPAVLERYAPRSEPDATE